MAAYAAPQLAHELAGTPEGKDAVIVVLLPDSGRGYLTKVFNDEWLGQYGFPAAAPARAAPWGRCCAARTGGCPTWCTPTRARRSPRPSHILQEYGVSQMPVVRAEPPIVAAEVAGSVSERALLDALFAGHARLDRPGRGPHVARRCPRSARPSRRGARSRCSRAPTRVLVHEDGKPVGVLTRQDLLAFLAR